MRSFVLTVSAVFFSSLFFNATGPSFQTPARANCLAPWTGEVKTILALGSQLSTVNTSHTGPEELEKNFTQLIAKVRNSLDAQYYSRIEGLAELENSVTVLPTDSAKWADPVVDILCDRLEGSLEKIQGPTGTMRFSPKSVARVLEKLALETKRPVSPEKLLRFENLVQQACQRYPRKDESDYFEYKTLESTIIACANIPDQLKRKKEFYMQYKKLFDNEKHKNFQGNSLVISPYFYTPETINAIPQIKETAAMLMEKVNQPVKNNQYGYPEAAFDEIKILNKMAFSLPKQMQNRLLTIMMTSDSGRIALQDTFYRQWATPILEKLCVTLTPEQARSILQPHFEKLLANTNLKKEQNEILNQFQAIYRNTFNNPQTHATLKQIANDLGFTTPSNASKDTQIEIGDEFYMDSYLANAYPFLQLPVWEPDLALTIPETGQLSPQTVDKDLEFDKKVNELLRLNTLLLKETAKPMPSVAELEEMITAFLELYSQLLNFDGANNSLGNLQTPYTQLEQWLDRLTTKLQNATPDSIPGIAQEIRQENGFVNVIHRQALWLQHNMSSSLSSSSEMSNKTTVYMHKTQINITNLTGQPLFVDNAPNAPIADPDVARILRTISTLGPDDVKEIYMTLRPDLISMHIQVRDHYAELTLNTRAPADGGSFTFSFTDPDDARSVEVYRARIIAQTLRLSLGLNKTENQFIHQSGVYVDGNINLNAGLTDKQSLMDTAILAIQLICRSAHLIPEANTVDYFVNTLLENGGRLKKDQIFDIILGRKHKIPQSRAKYQQLIHELLSTELKRLGLPNNLVAADKLGQRSINTGFNAVIKRALAAGQIQKTPSGSLAPTPNFTDSLKRDIQNHIQKNPDEAFAMATAITNLKAAVNFYPVTNLGSLQIKQATQATPYGTLVFYGVFDEETNNCLYAKAALNAGDLPQNISLGKVLEMLGPINPCMCPELINVILEFSAKPDFQAATAEKLNNPGLGTPTHSAPITPVSGTQNVITGRIKFDRPGVKTDSSTILVSQTIRPRFVDLANQKIGAIWVTGNANALCHDANVVRELGINCFQLPAQTNTEQANLSVTMPDGTPVELRENMVVFATPADKRLFTWGIDPETGRQNPFFTTLADIVLKPQLFPSKHDAAAALTKRMLLFPVQMLPEISSMVLAIYLHTPKAGLEEFLRTLPERVTQKALREESIKLNMETRQAIQDFEHDLAQASSRFEINTLLSRLQADLQAIEKKQKIITNLNKNSQKYFSDFSVHSIMHKQSNKAFEFAQNSNFITDRLGPLTVTEPVSGSQDFNRNEWILTSDELLTEQTPLADIIGNKGAQLVKMNTPGFAVPVWASNTIRKLLSATDIDESGKSLWQQIVTLVETESDPYKLLEKMRKYHVWEYLPQGFMDSLKKASNKLQNQTVAVRTSGVGEDGQLSFAGIGQSFPKVYGIQDTATAIVGVIASSSTAKASQYLTATNDERTHIEMPVWIHPTIYSQYSAVVFTRNPSSGRKQIIIQGVKGFLGHVVDASVEPDTIVFEKDSDNNYHVVGIPQIGSKEFYEFAHDEGTGAKKVSNTLEESRSFCLPAKILKKILEHTQLHIAIQGQDPAFIAGLDMEIAVDIDDNVHVVQLRPITTGKMISGYKASLITALDTAA